MRPRPYVMPAIEWSCDPTWSFGVLLVARAHSNLGTFVAIWSNPRDLFMQRLPRMAERLRARIETVSRAAWSDLYWPNECGWRCNRIKRAA